MQSWSEYFSCFSSANILENHHVKGTTFSKCCCGWCIFSSNVQSDLKFVISELTSSERFPSTQSNTNLCWCMCCILGGREHNIYSLTWGISLQQQNLSTGICAFNFIHTSPCGSRKVNWKLIRLQLIFPHCSPHSTLFCPISFLFLPLSFSAPSKIPSFLLYWLTGPRRNGWYTAAAAHCFQ